MLSLWGRWWVFLFPDLWIKRPCTWESPISILTWCHDWWDYEHTWRGNYFAYGKDALNAGSDRLKIKALKSHTSQYSEPYMVPSHVCFAQKTNNKFNAQQKPGKHLSTLGSPPVDPIPCKKSGLPCQRRRKKEMLVSSSAVDVREALGPCSLSPASEDGSRMSGPRPGQQKDHPSEPSLFR